MLIMSLNFKVLKRRTMDVTPSTSNDAMNKNIPIIVISEDEEVQ